MLSLKIPSSKSVSNRVLVLAAFAGKGKIIRNILKAEDTEVMFQAYDKVGVKYEVLNEDSSSIDIKIISTAVSDRAEFYMNNSGTSTRFLIPCICLLKGEFILDGVERMRQRPIGDLVSALRDLGVQIDYLGDDGFLPLKILSNGNLTGTARIKCNLSSQYLSGLLMARELSGQSFEIEIIGNTLVSKPYIDLTEAVLDEFKNSSEFTIETDYSSASYFIALGVLGDKAIFIENIADNSLQADKKLVEVLESLGAYLKFENGGLLSTPGKLNVQSELNIDCTEFPDSTMTLAIVCGLLVGVKSKLNGISTLKHKECNRLLALETEMNKVGILVKSDDDSLTIEGISFNDLKAAQIETYKDHRMAMCFAILKYFNSEIEILDPACVNKTFPEFWDKFELL